MNNTPIVSLFFVLSLQGLSAQSDPGTDAKVSFSGYVEPYYNYDFNKPTSGNRPDFLYAYNRTSEVNIHLGFLKANYEATNVRANAAMAVGTYMNANYSFESGVLKNILEMNAGVRLSKKHDLWLDAGVFGSHIGFESAIGKDCRTLSRSIMAENCPYFETGAKITYNSPDEKWTLSGLLLNGWQRIQRVEGNTLPSFGTQVQYKPNDKIVLNSSTFIGTDTPDDFRRMRYFHDFYGIFQLNDHWEVTAGIDVGWEQTAPESSDYYTWSAPALILRYAANSKCSVAVRAEAFRDENGVLLRNGIFNGFNVMGMSLNFDYAISENAVWRLEGRYLDSRSKIFQKENNALIKTNTCLSTSLAVSF